MLHPAGVGAGLAGGATLLGGFGPAVAAGGIGSALYTQPGLKFATRGVHPLVDKLRKRLGSKGTYNPQEVEDILNQYIGRSATAAGTE
jgi:hypothetical protein